MAHIENELSGQRDQVIVRTSMIGIAANIILAALGWSLHSIVPESELNDKIMEYGDYIKWTIIGLVGIGIVFLIVRNYLRKKAS